ncbi:glutamate-rich protein 6-like isoform X1 [Fundulus heteroclitus]|uniref:glutamate-rich protein 6-like isoform X1 n=1 Tax=Fundulus heteroclitus TaxID=8078 RepID=UPI00165ADEDD|nr:glutamate-rich protein 6-like isoform X1 [Fundulus heteroclitus]
MQLNSGRTGSRESSSEILTIQTFEGRLVTRFSVGTQTDWRHDDEHCEAFKTPNAPLQRSLTTETMTGEPRCDDSSEQRADNERVLKNMEPELKISPDNEMLDLHSKETPHAPTACQEGTEETLTNLDKIPASSGSAHSLHAALNICPKRSQPLKKPPVTSGPTASRVDPKESFSSKNAKETFSEALSQGGPVTTHATDTEPVKKEDQRQSELRSREDSHNGTPGAGRKQDYATSPNLPLGDALATKEEALLPEIEINCDSVFSFKLWREKPKGSIPLVKRYDDGSTFTVIFPDGTGQVRYPSGRLAILVAAAQLPDCSCVVVLEDKKDDPRVQGVFTSRELTCYVNGSIWVNLTSRGGISFSETGDVKKHWSWQENKHHIRAPPCQPLSLALSPHINVHIKSQEDICILFASHKHTVKLNKEAQQKANQSRNLTAPGADSLQTYLKQKSAEIKALLQNIQSLVTYQRSASPPKVKLQQSLILQMERQQLPVKRQSAAKKTPQSGQCPSIGFSNLCEATRAAAHLEFEFSD